MKFTKHILPLILLTALVVSGCASSRSGRVYTRDQARASHSVYYGVVTSVEPVLIEGTKTPAGTIAGGAAGAAIGNTIGSGSGRTLATVLGGIFGGLAGTAVEEGVTRREALEITVRLESGQTIAVVQEADELYGAGDRVRILKGSDGSTRVRPAVTIQ